MTEQIAIDVFHTSRRGASIGRTFYNENDCIQYLNRLHRPAIIKVKGEIIGRVWKDTNTNKWTWLYSDPYATKGTKS